MAESPIIEIFPPNQSEVNPAEKSKTESAMVPSNDFEGDSMDEYDK